MSMTLISHQELTSAQASITFSSIPQTFTDLYLVFSGRNSNAVNDNEIVQMRFNSDSGGNYSNRILLGTGSSAISQTTGTTFINTARCPSDGRTANTFGSIMAYMPNYRVSASKSVSVDGVEENNATSAVSHISAGLWNNNNAISSITLNFGAGNFMTNSSATLYGVTSGTSGGVTVS